jgi:cation:H+ antiporter
MQARKQAATEGACGEPISDAQGSKKLIRDIILLVIGAALIAIGADLLVDNGTIIAQALGVPESVIALTFVALGTSLPELVTAITSLAKGHGALSLGNVIGANLFNLVLVSGTSMLLSPFTLPVGKTIAGLNASLVVDIPVMLGVMLILVVPSLVRGKLARWQGIALLAIYAAFCVLQFAL